MARYVLEHTYSLQLAAVYVLMTDNYQNDYRELNKKMTKIKANMPESKPIGAFPIMEIELATGLPSDSDSTCIETKMKENAESDVRKKMQIKSKLIDSYIDGKGEDSTIAVIHIDGNNMGLVRWCRKETNHFPLHRELDLLI